MRFVLIGAVAVIIGAAWINISRGLHPLSTSQVVASSVLALGVAIQRIHTVERWLTAPRDNRKTSVEALAQQTLLRICEGRLVTRELKELRVHVWEVPLWYRRSLRFWLRKRLKAASARGPMRIFRKWIVRPTLSRVAAVGLLTQPPSGVGFRKGIGLVGVCIANNDHGEFITLDIADPKYQRALAAKTEDAWKRLGAKLTHNLPREDALRLSHSYCQVIGKVVQNAATGEAIGCVTISIKDCLAPGFRLEQEPSVKSDLTDLALGVAFALA